MASTNASDGLAEYIEIGPDGDFGIGPIDGARFRKLLLLIWLPSIVLLFFSFSWVTAGICLLALIVSHNLSRITGTPEVVDGTTWRCIGAFAAASAALFFISLVMPNSSNLLLAAIGGLYLGFVLIGLSVDWLPAWRSAPVVNALYQPEVTPTELRALCIELDKVQMEMRQLPVFDEHEPELVTAWYARDASRIAELLQEGNRTTEEAWKDGATYYNEAVSNVERGRKKLWRLLILTETKLQSLHIDPRSIDIERSKYAHFTIGQAIPKNLRRKKIDARQSTFMRGAGNVAARGIVGNVPPLVALAVVSAAFVARQISESRTLRRLKDAEGQLKVNAQAAQGDLVLIATVLQTRIRPQLEAMADVIERLEGGLNTLRGTSGNMETAQAQDLAFALLEGKKLVSIMAGN